MITLAQLENLFPNDSASLYQYLINKNIGGKNNSKGSSFENYFTVYKIAEAFNIGLKQSETFFSSQVLCFIDDLIIRHSLSNKFEHFQIKDVKKLSWETGKHPIKKDFEKQNLVYINSVKSDLSLVVSNKVLFDTLIATRPIAIEKIVKVIHFETSTSINKLLGINAKIKNELVKMSAISKPNTYILEALGTSILGVWDATNKTDISLEEIIQTCNTYTPNYIKGFTNQISSELRAILLSIPGFIFQIENGYIKWSFSNTDEGILQYVIGSSYFVQWENDIRSNNLKSFDEIEPYLS